MKKYGEDFKGIFHQMNDNGKLFQESLFQLADTYKDFCFETRTNLPGKIIVAQNSLQTFRDVMRKNKQKYRTKKLQDGLVIMSFIP